MRFYEQIENRDPNGKVASGLGDAKRRFQGVGAAASTDRPSLPLGTLPPLT
jgi:hypothetical protein